MISADWILTNAHILTMDGDLNQFEVGALAVKGDSIVDLGPSQEVLSRVDAAQVIDCGGKILMPGLINAHTHVPMTLLRGLADDLRLDVWLLGYMMPVEREFVSPDFVRLGTQIACAEMIRSGVTAFADMYYFEEDVAKATAEAGMRAVCGQTVLKFPSPDAESFEEALALARDFIQRWKGHPLIVPSIAPHAPYTCTPEILRSAAALAVEFDVPLHIHISETAQEVENMRRDQGMPVVPYVKKQNLLDAKVLAAHCVHIDEGEMRSLMHAGAGVAHNPSSNLKLASGFAPVSKMVEIGLHVGIGTDGPASNNDLDMFEEVRLAAFLAKSASNDPTVIPAQTALLMATRIGAQALHIGHLTGSLETGKRADLILIDINPLHNTPRFRRDANAPYAQIVYAAKSSDVSDVMVNGQWLMRTKQLLTLDEAQMVQAGQEYARKIDAFLIRREQSVLSKLIAIGGAMEEESFEIQAKIPVASLDLALAALKNPSLTILRKRHYREYDLYYSFEDPDQGILRYREDDFIDDKGNVSNVRSRLTLIGSHEHNLPQVLLSRSRFYAPATHSQRFYREYFKPSSEVEVVKDRLRYQVSYKNTEFFINLDSLSQPALGRFIEIKARTWSRQDARSKASLTNELIELLGADPAQTVSSDYIDMIKSS
jgi:5-methylthioadenosine/S-adenosylhomocysteine deaminase